MACTYILDGKELTYEEFAQKLQEGLMKEVLDALNTPPPPTGTTTKVEGGEEQPKMKKRSVIASMIKAVDESQRERVESDGLYYSPQNKLEAEKIAESVFKENGLYPALEMARDKNVDGVVRAALYSRVLNEMSALERAAKTNEEKIAYAKEGADIFTEFAKENTEAGKLTSGATIFYDSPLGQEFYENKRREEEFKKVEKENGKSWEQALKQFKESEEFAAVVQEEVDKVLVKDKNFARKAAASLDKLADKIEKEGIKSVLPDWLKADLPEGTQQQGIDINVLNKAVATAIRAISAAIKAGGKLSEVVNEQAKTLKEKYGLSADQKEIANWLRQQYRQTGAVEKSMEEKVSERIESLNKSIANLKEKIAKGEYTPKEKQVETEEIKKLLEQKKELEKQYNEIKKNTEAYKERVNAKFLDSLKKKLDGMNEAQKGEVIRRMFKKATEAGALEREDLRTIIADVLGLGKMDNATAARFRQYVENISALDKARQEFVDNPTKENRKRLEDAETLGIESKRELGKIVYNQTDLMARIRQMIQLNVMSPVTLTKNVTWNIFEQATRFTGNAFVGMAEKALYASSWVLNKATNGKTKIYQPQTSVIDGFNPFFRSANIGIKQGINTMFKGVSSKDIFSTTMVESPIQPIKSAKDVKNEIILRLKERLSKSDLEDISDGSPVKRMSNAELVDKLIQSTAGFYGEFAARTMSLFDKPARFGAESAKSITMAKNELGVTDKAELELFERYPKEAAYKHLKSKGLSDIEATEKAEVFQERALRQGDKAVMQQENLLSDFITRMGKVSDEFEQKYPIFKLISKPFQIATMPAVLFRKTPANIAWKTFKMINPEVALIEAAANFAKAKRMKKQGDERYKIQLDEVRDNLGVAAVGFALGAVVSSLIDDKIIIPTSEEDDRKGQSAEKNYAAGNKFNYSRFKRLLLGEPLDAPKGESDYLVDMSWFGTTGAIMDLKARLKKQFDKDKETQSYITELGGRLYKGVEVSANATVLEAQKTFTRALSSEDGFTNYGVGFISTMLSPVPFSGSFSRAALDYEYRIKGDNFLDQLKNRFSADNVIYRKLANQYPPARIGVWGDKIYRGGSDFGTTALRYFGISKMNPNAFARPIYDDFVRTGNTKFFPSEPLNKVTYEGVEYELSTQQHDRLKEPVGQRRKSNISAILNSDILIVRNRALEKVKYNQLNDEEKAERLQQEYKRGFEEGKEMFFQEMINAGMILNTPEEKKKREKYLNMIKAAKE